MIAGSGRFYRPGRRVRGICFFHRPLFCISSSNLETTKLDVSVRTKGLAPNPNFIQVHLVESESCYLKAAKSISMVRRSTILTFSLKATMDKKSMLVSSGSTHRRKSNRSLYQQLSSEPGLNKGSLGVACLGFP